MALEGTVTVSSATAGPKALSESDLLKADDLVEVSAGSYVDLAYDRDWSNITRVEENSKVRLKSIVPAKLELQGGGVFAKLKSLPRDSTFDVMTPTAIASVRGTEYRTTFLSGETQIYNVSDSDVYVFGLDDAGEKKGEAMILGRSQTTQVQRRGVGPLAPRPMQERDFQPVRRFQEGIDRKIQDNISKGRVGKVQDIRTIERMHEKGRHKPRTLNADEAGKAARQVGGDGVPRLARKEGAAQNEDPVHRGGAGVLRSDEFGKRTVAGESQGNEEDRRGEFSRSQGLGEPFFPGNEKRRGGGPEPVNFPRDRWKSGVEGAEGAQDSSGHNAPMARERKNLTVGSGQTSQQGQSHPPPPQKKGQTRNKQAARPQPRR